MDISVLLQNKASLRVSALTICHEEYIMAEIFNHDYCVKRIFDADDFSEDPKVCLQMIADEFEKEVNAGK